MHISVCVFDDSCELRRLPHIIKLYWRDIYIEFLYELMNENHSYFTKKIVKAFKQLITIEKK